MDAFEWNKIAGAVLFALLLAVGLNIFSEILFESEAPETPGYVIALATEGEGGAAAEEPAGEPIGVLLASADPDAGANAAKKCVACHTFAEGEANKVGPNLWGVVMHPIAAHEGYQYSDAMKAHAEEAKDWSYDNLNTYLTNPTGVVPGTKMTFPGVKNDAERANVIAYLRTLAAEPAPLPEPEAAAPAEGDEAAAPAEEPAAEEETAAKPEEAAPAEEGEAQAEATEEAAPAEETAKTEEAAPEQEVAAADAAKEPAPEAPAPQEETAEAGTSEEPAAEEQVAQAEQPADVPAGDVAKGETFAKRCLACHTVDEGGAKKVGPPLFGVVGRPIASVPDFAYSDAMKAFGEGGKTWDPATLDSYLADPRGVVKGTKMIFPGVRAEADRANVIAYLATLK